jgi:UDP-glucose 4-epimerase
MKVLITGGAGFIGSHLAHRFIDTNGVTVLDDLSTGSVDNLAGLNTHTGYSFVQGSVLDRALVEGTETVLSACLRHRRKVLVASTSEVYGKNPTQPLCETADSVFGSSAILRWSYATAKKLDEFLALAYYETHGLPVIVTRFFNIVGPRQTGRYGMVLPNFIRAALSGSPIRVFGDGMQTRNFTAVGDCLHALTALLSEPLADGKIFNIGGSLEISIRDLAQRVKVLTGSSSPIQFVPYQEAYPEGSFEDMRARVPCICRIAGLTGWKPQITLDQIIVETAKHEMLAHSHAGQLAGLSGHVSAEQRCTTLANVRVSG